MTGVGGGGGGQPGPMKVQLNAVCATGGLAGCGHGDAATLDDGRVIVMGGQDAQESRIVDQLARLPSSNQWTATETMLVPRHGFELAVFEGRAWACGGGSQAGLHPVATCTSVL